MQSQHSMSMAGTDNTDQQQACGQNDNRVNKPSSQLNNGADATAVTNTWSLQPKMPQAGNHCTVNQQTQTSYASTGCKRKPLQGRYLLFAVAAHTARNHDKPEMMTSFSSNSTISPCWLLFRPCLLAQQAVTRAGSHHCTGSG
jgi:hypothetical protein